MSTGWREIPVPIQLPMGSEDAFEGLIDLVQNTAFVYPQDGEQGPVRVNIPDEYREMADKYRDSLIEKVSETDDDLLAKYIEGQEITVEELKSGLRQATIDNKLVPVMCGAALKNKGIQLMLDAVLDYLPSPLDVPPVEVTSAKTGEKSLRETSKSAPFAALAFKVVTDPYVGRLVYCRVYSGKVKSGATVYNSSRTNRERIGRLLKMHANHREEVSEAIAGDIVAAIGLKNTYTGNTVCEVNAPILLESITFPDPVISVAVEPRSKIDQDRLNDALVKMADEDPTLQLNHDDETGQTVIQGMGEMHLEVTVERIRREQNVDVRMGKPQVAYRETITSPGRAVGRLVKQTGGHGQFAHVVMDMEPLEAGQGFQFVNQIRGGDIPSEYIPSVEKGIKEAMSTGVLAGYPVVDIKATLVDGSFHPVDSSDMAFQIAGAMALREGVRKCQARHPGTGYEAGDKHTGRVPRGHPGRHKRAARETSAALPASVGRRPCRPWSRSRSASGMRRIYGL